MTNHGYLRIDLQRLALEVALADLILALAYAAGGSYLCRAFWSTVIPTRVLTRGQPLAGCTRAVATRGRYHAFCDFFARARQRRAAGRIGPGI